MTRIATLAGKIGQSVADTMGTLDDLFGQLNPGIGTDPAAAERFLLGLSDEMLTYVTDRSAALVADYAAAAARWAA